MKKIILDTNFLLIPGSLKIDIFDEIDKLINFKYELYIIDKTNKELELIKNKQKGKTTTDILIAISLIKQKHLKIIPTSKSNGVDDTIVSLVNENYIVATQDKELKKRVKEKGAGVIILKQKKYLYLEE